MQNTADLQGGAGLCSCGWLPPSDWPSLGCCRHTCHCRPARLDCKHNIHLVFSANRAGLPTMSWALTFALEHAMMHVPQQQQYQCLGHQ